MPGYIQKLDMFTCNPIYKLHNNNNGIAYQLSVKKWSLIVSYMRQVAKVTTGQMAQIWPQHKATAMNGFKG